MTTSPSLTDNPYGDIIAHHFGHRLHPGEVKSEL